MTSNGSGWYKRYGLHLLSEIPFGLPVTAPSRGADITVVSRGRHEDHGRTELGEVLAELRKRNGDLSYAFARDAAGYRLRVCGVADFVISHDVSTVVCEIMSFAPEGLTELLLQATVLAFLLSLRGKSVLHGSAVVHGDKATVVAGPSRAGKSTLAALLCAGGASLLADDLVCIEGRSVLGAGPGVELRIRPAVRDVVQLFEVQPSSEDTSDNRLAIRPPFAGDQPFGLSALLFPVVGVPSESLRARALSPEQALPEIIRSARISGWRDPAQQRSFLDAAVRLAKGVPAYKLHLPRAPLQAIGREALEAVLSAASSV